MKYINFFIKKIIWWGLNNVKEKIDLIFLMNQKIVKFKIIFLKIKL
jgi:hypothetical protein